jgi:hypothetical protein
MRTNRDERRPASLKISVCVEPAVTHLLSLKSTLTLLSLGCRSISLPRQRHMRWTSLYVWWIVTCVRWAMLVVVGARFKELLGAGGSGAPAC